MRKILLLAAATICIVTCSIGQTAMVKGTITDTINKQNLNNTVICLLRAKDSILVKFTRSNSQGNFQLGNIKAGKYILFATCPQYADYSENLELTDTSVINTGIIKLILKANLLQEVIVKQQIGSIRMKGDTTEFIADSFKVQPNATVEDLLKKIPTVQVDKDGNITAQGETVPKILVDGEEFFGDDPTLVTQNLRADMIAAVQIFDKKSDQAAFTGIDDGNHVKTINLKLKENKKNGYFGKLNAGGGTDGYHENQAMINLFKNKLKAAAYVMVSNTGKTGLNWEDIASYGDASGSVGNNDDIEEWDGRYSGRGYPLTQTGGLHFNNKWNDGKNNLNVNYKILNLGVTGSSIVNSQNILSNDTINYNNTYEKYKNSVLRNRFGGTYELQLDSMSSIKISADGGMDHKITSKSDSSESLTNDQRVNNSLRNLNTTGDQNTVNSNIFYRKKFKKLRRTLSVNFYEDYTVNKATGYLNSYIDTFKNNVFAGRTITDQFKTYNSTSLRTGISATYTEPLSKNSSLTANYSVSTNNNNSLRNSYNKSADGKYTALDTVYSNHYKYNVFTQRTGLGYHFNTKKLIINANNDFGFTDYTQQNLRAATTQNRSFVNFYPSANFNYLFTQQRRVGINYNGNTSQPSIDEIQPVATNENPLNITVGNPGLKPAFDNSIRLYFGDYKIISQTDLFVSLGYNFENNTISDNTHFDALSGKSVTQFVNVNGNHSFTGWASYDFKIKQIGTTVGFNGNFNNGRNVNLINNVLNTTHNQNYTGGIRLEKEKENKYSASINFNATYINSRSTIQLNAPVSYWQYTTRASANVYLPWKMQINANGSYNIQQKTAALSAYNAFILNAWIGKKLLKKDALLIKVSGNDILNQNQNFTRNVQSNFITQNTYSNIKRYFLLSILWNFNKTDITATAQN